MHDPLSERRPDKEQEPDRGRHRMPEGSYLYDTGVPIILAVLAIGTLVLIVAVLFVVLSNPF